MHAVVSADFETTTDPKDCRVWLWSICSVSPVEETAWGKDISSFFRYVFSRRIEKIFFHNLKFDGGFIVDYLFRVGYVHSTERDIRRGEFSCLMDSKGKLYQILINAGKGRKLRIWDSLKLFPQSVEELGKIYGGDLRKGSIDYEAVRPVGYEPTADEVEYCLTDTIIVSRALMTVQEGPGKMTVGANALAWFINDFGKSRFRKVFPVLTYDEDAMARAAYKGGYTYVDPSFAERVTGNGLSVDYNSMYPSQMDSQQPFPVGYPEEFEGRYENDGARELYIQYLTCTLTLKPGGLPMVQIKGSGFYGLHEYVRETVEPVQLALCNVDLELLFDNYEVDVYSWDGGQKYMDEKGHDLFGSYYEHWGDIKRNSKGPERENAKLYNNSLYGKFATTIEVTGKTPVFEDGKVRWVQGETREREPVYVPVAVYTTAYARRALISAIKCNRDRFIYCDTDSMHLDGCAAPEGIKLHETDYGAWKVERSFVRAKHLRAKAYVLEYDDGTLEVRCAGMPSNVKELVTMENFVYGFSNVEACDEGVRIIPGRGKKQPKTVPGGVVLVDTVYTLHR